MASKPRGTLYTGVTADLVRRAYEHREGRGGRAMASTVYMLRCADGSYYVGRTIKALETRVSEHNEGVSDTSYTRPRRPVTLVFAEVYERIDDSIRRERQIKGWSRRKKEALIRGDYEALPDLASRPARDSSS